MPIYNCKTEELMIRLPIPYNIRLKRRKFIRHITQGLDVKVNILQIRHSSGLTRLQYSKKIKEVSSDGKKATAVFEDGTSETGDLLIGADGGRSVVRDYLVGSSKSALADTPIVSTFAIAQLPAEAVEKFRHFGNRMAIAFHPNGYFTWVGSKSASQTSYKIDAKTART